MSILFRRNRAVVAGLLGALALASAWPISALAAGENGGDRGQEESARTWDQRWQNYYRDQRWQSYYRGNDYQGRQYYYRGR